MNEQIDSILSQDEVQVKLFIRDDGSTDQTVKIIKTYLDQYPQQIELFLGKNIGYQKSFLHLINFPEVRDFDFIAFSDQDDIWFSKKLKHSCSQINGKEPILLVSNARVFIEGHGDAGALYPYEHKLNNFLDTNFRPLYGMTFVFNKGLLNILVTNNIDHVAFLGHDNWIASVAIACGKIFFLNESLTRYRQHDANASGFKGESSKISKMIHIIGKATELRKRIRKNSGYNSMIAKLILVELNPFLHLSERKLAEEIIRSRRNFFSRVHLFFSRKFTVGSLAQDLVLRVLLIRGRI
ncbi:glycosyltransferase [Oenococcus sicerae]|uniref:Glycosyltransferase n=1 Tax=Oenococcus sicerae TaxID=2203724 RepID=A0ABX5QKM4_9LACO|nr:glycosyltransferase [Oenococcus sicerae]QAS69331.2 glycosyltransferase [Oenococcus sicerae]